MLCAELEKIVIGPRSQSLEVSQVDETAQVEERSGSAKPNANGPAVAVWLEAARRLDVVTGRCADPVCLGDCRNASQAKSLAKSNRRCDS